MTEPNYAHALTFLQAITGEDDPEILFAAIYDPKPENGAKKSVRHYRGTLRNLWYTLVAENKARHGIFFTVQQVPGSTREARDVTGLRAVFIDQDHGPFLEPNQAHLPPSLMVNTGKGRHTYWLLKEGQPVSEFSGVQRRLIRKYHSDKQVNDLPRVMRMPGFFHHKADPVYVQWFDVDPKGDAVYTLGEVVQGLPADSEGRTGPVGFALPEAGTRKLTQSDFSKWEKSGKVSAWAIEMVKAISDGGVALLNPEIHMGNVDGLVTKLFAYVCGKFPDATLESLVECIVGPWTLLSALDSAAGRPAYSVDDLVSKLARAQSFVRENHQQKLDEHPWLDMVSRNEQGQVVPTRGNIEHVFRHHPKWKGVLGFDLRARRMVYRAPAPWIGLPWAPHARGASEGAPGAEGQTISEHHAGLVASWFAQAEHLHIPGLHTTTVHEAVDAVAMENGFDPFKEWLDSQTWDGTERLVKWLSTYLGCEDTEWTRAVGPKWLVAAVARTYEPGCKVDEMLVLEGAQGARKSSALRALAGAEYFTDSLPRGGDATDMATALVGPVIVEIPEIDGVNRKKEASEVKAFLSKQTDRYRPKYGRREVEVPRRCVFAGSTNESEYLVDQTGGRRFWPVKVGITRDTMDVDGIMADRGQLWAEAKVLYLVGCPWHLNSKENALAQGAAKSRTEVDPWVEPIRAWIERGGSGIASNAMDVALGQTAPKEPANRFSTADVLEKALGMSTSKWTTGDARRTAHILRAMGFETVKVKGYLIWKRDA